MSPLQFLCCSKNDKAYGFLKISAADTECVTQPSTTVASRRWDTSFNMSKNDYTLFLYNILQAQKQHNNRSRHSPPLFLSLSTYSQMQARSYYKAWALRRSADKLRLVSDCNPNSKTYCDGNKEGRSQWSGLAGAPALIAEPSSGQQTPQPPSQHSLSDSPRPC